MAPYTKPTTAKRITSQGKIAKRPIRAELERSFEGQITFKASQAQGRVLLIANF